MNVLIIDTGCANLASLRHALQRLGIDPAVSADPAAIATADKLLLPGVGTARSAMDNLHDCGLIAAIQNATQPLLGICLGLQLLTDHSAEGDLATLGLIPGTTVPLPAAGLPLPHMGWNRVSADRDSPLFADIPPDSYFYFVHSYGVLDSPDTIARCDYGGPFAAALGRGKRYGVQFHPERSGAAGARLLHNFIYNCP